MVELMALRWFVKLEQLWAMEKSTVVGQGQGVQIGVYNFNYLDHWDPGLFTCYAQLLY